VDPQESAVISTEETPEFSAVTVTEAIVDAEDLQAAADTIGVPDPDPVDFVGTSATFAYRSADTQMGAASLSTLAVPAFPNPLTLIGAAVDYALKGIHDRMNPLISGALGVWHLQTGINQIKTLHLIGGALNLTLGVLSFATVGLGLIPVPGVSLLIPVTATLATGLATVNTIGSGLLHW
jgi:hypothetical protein